MEKEQKLKIIKKIENKVTHQNSVSYSVLGDYIAGHAIDAILEAGYDIVPRNPCPECGAPLVSGPGGGEECGDKCGYWFCF